MTSASEPLVAVEPSANPEANASEPSIDTKIDVANAWLREQERLITAAIGPNPDRSYQLISSVLENSFGNDPDTDTMEKLISSLSVVLGDEQATRALLTTVAQCFNDHSYLHQLGEVTEGFRDWIQELVALYGWAISRAHRLEGEDPLGWLNLDRYVYREAVGRQWRVRMVVTLNDGSKVTIHDRPENFARLAEAVLNSLTYIPGEALDEIISTRQIERLGTAYNDFMSLLQQSVPAPDASGPSEPASASK
jgi:hypothetical protein